MPMQPSYVAGAIFLAGVLLVCVAGALRHQAKEVRLLDFVRAARQWSAASRDDDTALAALLHAAYASAYLSAARALAPDTELEEVTRAPLAPLVEAVEQTQRAAVAALQRQLQQQAAPPAPPDRKVVGGYRPRP